MTYDIFDTNTILLGLLSAVLAAECIILFVRIQSMRHKINSRLEEFVRDERMKIEHRKSELELELKQRAMSLESEYENLESNTRQAKALLDEQIEKSRFEIQKAKIASQNAENEHKNYLKLAKMCEEKLELYTDKLAQLSGLDAEKLREEAKSQILKSCKESLNTYRRELFKKSALEIDMQAKRILIDSVMRAATNLNAQINSNIVKLPNEAMKGRLIGKEGRNIRSFEAATETTLVIDETPDSVMISSFDPARREIAKVALTRLLQDGRINPLTIESAVASAKSEVEKDAIDYGRAACEQTNIKNLPDEVLTLLGNLRFHLSLNQNSLEHSVETAQIAAALAIELDCDPYVARRSGLLHDIGKATHSELSHARSGAQILRKYGEDEIVVRAVEGHHDEVAGGIYGAIVKIADTISATRPGARMEPVDGYFTRMKTLEDTAKSFEGVLSAYALQAGRELRVIVEPEKVDDESAVILLAKIKDKISEKIDRTVPVKITLIRERRFTV